MTTIADHADHRPLITICVPVLNEEGNIDRLIERLRDIAGQNAGYEFEFLFTDNASTDDTFAKLADWVKRDPRVRALRFSRNFGFQRSILTNMFNARGLATIQIDADLQDPPELITAFLAHWRKGYKVVYGIRRRRQENFFLLAGRKLHYRLINSLSENEVPLDSGDFRLVDRTIIDHLRDYNDRAPYIRGMIASLGYTQIGIPYDRSARTVGASKFNLLRLLALSFDGMCSQSTKPLQFITFFGFGLSIVAVLLVLFYFWLYVLGYDTGPRGFMTLVLLILLSIAINAAFVGVLGEYIGRIFNVVRGGPLAVVVDRLEGVPRDEQDQPQAKN
ncbi:MAG: glycosyltransferase family 2 protein [Beijerinckiaceae bacterium]